MGDYAATVELVSIDFPARVATVRVIAPDVAISERSLGDMPVFSAFDLERAVAAWADPSIGPAVYVDRMGRP